MGHLLFLCDFLILVLFTSRIVIFAISDSIRLGYFPFNIGINWIRVFVSVSAKLTPCYPGFSSLPSGYCMFHFTPKTTPSIFS